MEGKPKALLFARAKDTGTAAGHKRLGRKITLLNMYCREYGYYITQGFYVLTDVENFEKKMLPAFAKDRRNQSPETITLIICNWNDIAAKGRRTIIRKELLKMNIKVKVIIYDEPTLSFFSND